MFLVGGIIGAMYVTAKVGVIYGITFFLAGLVAEWIYNAEEEE